VVRVASNALAELADHSIEGRRPIAFPTRDTCGSTKDRAAGHLEIGTAAFAAFLKSLTSTH
jgi:hypothetical protein